MEQYINKAAVVAEIERIKKEECPIDTYEGRMKLFYFERFLSFIDTLETKEGDEIIKTAEDHAYFAGSENTRKKLVDKACEWLKSNLYDYAGEDDKRNIVPFDDAIFEDFKKAMEE